MKDIKGLLVLPNGDSSIIELPPTIDAFWKTVGNWVEIIAPAREAELTGWHAYCDEDGRLKQLPENKRATDLATAAGWHGRYPLVGPVLFVGLTGHHNDADVPQALLRLDEEISGHAHDVAG